MKQCLVLCNMHRDLACAVKSRSHRPYGH